MEPVCILSNSRQIPISPVSTGILEKHVHDSLNICLSKYKLLQVSCQFGSRENHSHITIIIKIVNKWIAAMEEGFVIGTTLTDLSLSLS